MDKSIFQTMKDRWPSPIVARTEIETFTGGAIKEKYAANLDAGGLGCPGRFRLGRKVIYPVAELVAWLESRSSTIQDKHREA